MTGVRSPVIIFYEIKEREEMMENFLYGIVALISRIHNTIMMMNDGIEYTFTDKELHFIIIGLLGIGMIFIVHPIFNWLAKKNHILTISFLYVFTVIIVITFAIEIGQRVTGTGAMEFADITAGVLGFLAAFIVFAIIRGIYRAIRNALNKKDN